MIEELDEILNERAREELGEAPYASTEPLEKTATFVSGMDDWRGDARLYRVEPALEGYEFVVVSAASVPYSGPETYIFGSNAEGTDVNMSELDGSYRGGLSHRLALSNAGYTVID